MCDLSDLALKLGIICDRLKIEVFRRIADNKDYEELKSELILQTAKLNVVYARLSKNEIELLELIRESRGDNSVIRAAETLKL